MAANAIGDLNVQPLKTVVPHLSNDIDAVIPFFAGIEHQRKRQRRILT